MKKPSLLMLIACTNVIFAFLLIHKQNNIIKLLYEIQQLKEQREHLLELKKKLLIQLNKEEQLSSIHSFAQEQLDMKPLAVSEAKIISYNKESDGNKQ